MRARYGAVDTLPRTALRNFPKALGCDQRCFDLSYDQESQLTGPWRVATLGFLELDSLRDQLGAL